MIIRGLTAGYLSVFTTQFLAGYFNIKQALWVKPSNRKKKTKKHYYNALKVL